MAKTGLRNVAACRVERLALRVVLWGRDVLYHLAQGEKSDSGRRQIAAHEVPKDSCFSASGRECAVGHSGRLPRIDVPPGQLGQATRASGSAVDEANVCQMVPRVARQEEFVRGKCAP